MYNQLVHSADEFKEIKYSSVQLLIAEADVHIHFKPHFLESSVEVNLIRLTWDDGNCLQRPQHSKGPQGRQIPQRKSHRHITNINSTVQEASDFVQVFAKII